MLCTLTRKKLEVTNNLTIQPDFFPIQNRALRKVRIGKIPPNRLNCARKSTHSSKISGKEAIARPLSIRNNAS